MSFDQAKTAAQLLETLRYEIESALEKSISCAGSFCESPIETLLLAAFMASADFSRAGFNHSYVSYKIKDRDGGLWISARPGPDEKEPLITIIPQYEWKSYRIDFAFFLRGIKEPLIFVECDGHEFHERTKEQAERDRSRDRKVQTAGIKIFRFTGREVWRDAMGCVLQILSALG